MAVKVIEEHQSIGSNYIDWYRIELFNGIQGMDLSYPANSQTILINFERYRALCFEVN
jgi:hypothetical protein